MNQTQKRLLSQKPNVRIRSNKPTRAVGVSSGSVIVLPTRDPLYLFYQDSPRSIEPSGLWDSAADMGSNHMNDALLAAFSLHRTQASI